MGIRVLNEGETGEILDVYRQARIEGDLTEALPQSALSELFEVFRTVEGTEFICECVRVATQELIDPEAAVAIGAGRYERTESRVTERNESRPRLLTTHAEDIELAVPKLRSGSLFPSILSPRRRIDKALYALVMEAYVHGVSTRSVDLSSAKLVRNPDTVDGVQGGREVVG